jgi:hypothetical protein
MTRWILTLCLAGCLLGGPAQDKGKEKDRESELPGPRKTGRPGENTLQEEDALDKIIDRFIQYDLGVHRDPKAMAELNGLGPEAIPALIRGLNKSAKNGNSCPTVTLAKKLKQLLNASDDEKTLEFIRDNVGAGVGRTAYDPLMRDLKVATMLRKKQLAQLRAAAAAGAANSPGYQSPGEKPPQ